MKRAAELKQGERVICMYPSLLSRNEGGDLGTFEHYIRADGVSINWDDTEIGSAWDAWRVRRLCLNAKDHQFIYGKSRRVKLKIDLCGSERERA